MLPLKHHLCPMGSSLYHFYQISDRYPQNLFRHKGEHIAVIGILSGAVGDILTLVDSDSLSLIV